jgi:two-component system CheB/CheR fusion protein
MHALPNDGIAYVIITHLSPNHLSILPELLQQYTPIKVLSISNQQRIVANHIYVLPPGKKVAIHHGVLELLRQSLSTHAQLPIDFFLSSLAQDQGANVICVILSGMGHDGTLGLRAIRENRGLVIAQTVKSALYEAMPKSAINTGLVDYILLPEDMYAFIIKYMAHFNDNSIPLENNISTEIQQILTFINNQTGHDFSLYKPNTILRRIQKRLDTLQISTLSDYVYYFHQHPAEINILFKELLINVTHFFRDPGAFEQLKKRLLEKVLINKPEDSLLRVWVPACSTGEEAYSIAMVIYESMSLLKLNLSVQIFGTDIDADVVEIARAGIFPVSIKSNITPERLHRFFTVENGLYKINPEIRKMIIFAVQNIINDPPFTRLDLLSCRNLFIYLTSGLQKKILSLFHYSLNHQGLLFLGVSETVGGSENFFDVTDKKWKIFQRNKSCSSLQSARYTRSSSQLSVIINKKTAEAIMPEIELNLPNTIKNILFTYYTPTCVVIDEKGTIVYVHGRTGRFLEFSTGEARLFFLDLVRPELRTKLRNAIDHARTQRKEITLNNLQIKNGHDTQYMCVKIRQLSREEHFKESLLLIIFDEMIRPIVSEVPDRKGKSHQKLTQLEQELKYTKENLQTTIEELETSNDELKSSNEELQSTIEELQSTNEEIETSKEELQSLNEELSTVNAELENRIEQLSSANDDIKNLLDSTDIATIFLDRNLCIKRFTPKSTEIINLIATDVGRPVSHIVSNLHYETLVDDSRTVLKTLEPIMTENVDKNGHWYVIRIIPYRTITDHVDGVVITFINIHAQKQAEDQLNLIKKDVTFASDMNNELLNSIANAAIILDENAAVLLANHQFLKQFKIKSDDLIGHSIFSSKLQWDRNNLLILKEKILNSHSVVENYRLETSPSIGINITARRVSSAILLIVN